MSLFRASKDTHAMGTCSISKCVQLEVPPVICPISETIISSFPQLHVIHDFLR